MGRPLRVLIVGGGKMGLLHGALLRASRRAEVVGVVDPSRMSRFVVRASGLNVTTFPTLSRALAQVNADATFVCAPPAAHASIAHEALERGLHVFVEKPLTTSADASMSLASKADRAGIKGAVGYVRRHHVVYRAMKEALRNAPLERLSVRIRSPQFVGAGKNGIKRGGLEWDLLPHAVDMSFWLTDATEATPETITRRGFEQISASCKISGVAIDLEVDWACPDVRKVEMSVAAILRDGVTLYCDEDRLVESKGGSDRLIFHRRDAPAPWFDLAGHEFSHQALDVIDAFGGRASQSATLHEGARVDAFIARALALGGSP